MGNIRAGLFDGLWIATLFKQDFAEIAAASARRDDVRIRGQVGWRRVMRRHDQCYLQVGCDAAQIGEEVADILSAASVGLIPEPAVKSDVHGIVVSRLNFPIFNCKIGNSAKFSRVMCNKYKIMGQSDCGNHDIERADGHA